MENISTTEEKRITITNNHSAGSELKVVHTVSETGVIMNLSNGSNPIAIIPLTLEGIEKLAEWLTKRAEEIKKEQE